VEKLAFKSMNGIRRQPQYEFVIGNTVEKLKQNPVNSPKIVWRFMNHIRTLFRTSLNRWDVHLPVCWGSEIGTLLGTLMASERPEFQPLQLDHIFQKPNQPVAIPTMNNPGVLVSSQLDMSTGPMHSSEKYISNPPEYVESLLAKIQQDLSEVQGECFTNRVQFLEIEL